MIGQKQNISYVRVAAILEQLRGCPLERRFCLNCRKMAQVINDSQVINDLLYFAIITGKSNGVHISELYYGSSSYLQVHSIYFTVATRLPYDISIDSKDDFAQNDRQTKKATDLSCCVQPKTNVLHCSRLWHSPTLI